MSDSLPEFDYQRLTISERLDLIAQIWDSIPVSSEALPMPEWHRQELKRRLAAADASPEPVIPWEQIRDHLRSQGPK
jgi:putative addiction module component (TIGR02574 family)